MPTPTPIDVLMTNPPVVSVSDITDGTLTGAGVFDKLMLSVSAHLRDQLDKGRIQGTDFSAVYLEALKHTMSVSVELSLAKQKQAYEIQLLTKQNLLADEQINAAKLDADIKEYQLSYLLPNELARGVQQLDVIERTTVLQENQSIAQVADIEASTAIKGYQLSELLPNELARGEQQLDVTERTTVIQEQQSVAQIADTEASTAIKEYQLTVAMPVEVTNATKQGVILDKQSLIADEEIKSAKLSQDNAKKQNRLIERQTILTDGQMDLIHYDLNTKFPAEVANTLKQGLILDKEASVKQYQLDSLLPNELARGEQQLDVTERTTVLQENQSVAQVATSLLQQDLLTVQIETGEYTLATDMPISTGNLTKQGVLLDKQAETADAQIANVETQTTLYEQKTVSEQAQTDETVIGTGSLMDEQRLLVREQRLGFERDNMHKVAKVYADNWLARYTEQPGDTFAPNANLNDENAKQVMTKLLASLGLTPIAPAPAPPRP